MSSQTRVRISIFGNVQGVNFRNEALKLAEELEIKGYIANMMDGSVLIVAEGEKDPINNFIEFCKTGPEKAKVDRCEAYFQRFKNEFNKFEIK